MKEFNISTVRSAVEFGFKGHEKGYNLEKVLSDFDKLMEKYPPKSCSNHVCPYVRKTS